MVAVTFSIPSNMHKMAVNPLLSSLRFYCILNNLTMGISYANLQGFQTAILQTH